MTLVDTSVIVRYLTGDPPEQAEVARLVVDADEELTITDVVLAEASFVLASNYGHPREDVVDALAALVGRANIRTWPLDKHQVLDALTLCRPSSRVSIPDALTWAAARQASRGIVTFDRRFPGDGIQVRQLADGGPSES